MAKYKYETEHHKKKLEPNVQRFAKQVADDIIHGMPDTNTLLTLTLPALLEIKKQLESPIGLDLGCLTQTRLKPAQRNEIETWYRNNNQYLQIDGATASDRWGAKLEAVRNSADTRKAKFDQLLSLSQESGRKNDFEKAVALCREAMEIDPTSQAAKALLLEFRSKWTILEYNRIRQDIAQREIAQVEALIRTFHTKDSSPEKIERGLAAINLAQGKIDDFRSWAAKEGDLSLLATDQGEPNKTETLIATQRGRCYGENIWLMHNTNRFWDAYSYLRVVMAMEDVELAPKRLHHLAEHERTALQSPVRRSFEEILPAATAYCLRNANQRRVEGYNGLALVICRMDQEMCDFARRNKIDFRPEMTELLRQLNFAVVQAQDSLKTSSLQRRIFVDDFKSLASESKEDADKLTAMFRVDWLRRFNDETANSLQTNTFWNVEMNPGPPAAELQPGDYLVRGTLNEFYVESERPQELTPETVDVGLQPRWVDNPDRNERKNTPKLLEQDVVKQSRRTILEAKRAVVRADFSVTRGGRSRPLFAIDQTFDGHNALPNVILLDQAISVNAIGMRVIQTKTNEGLLPVGNLLSNTIDRVSSDREIRPAMRAYTREMLIRELESVVSVYPFEILADGLAKVKLGQQIDGANRYGECLEYCFELAACDRTIILKTHTDGGTSLFEMCQHGDWLSGQAAVSEKVARMCGSTWDSQPAEMKSLIGELWSTCVEAAVSTLKVWD